MVMKGPVAIVTGGGRRIGRAIRKKLGAEEAAVVAARGEANACAALFLVSDQSRAITVPTPNVDGGTTFD